MIDNRSERKIILTRRLVIIAGLVLLAVGLTRGEARFILRNAILICLECIGIG